MKRKMWSCVALALSLLGLVAAVATLVGGKLTMMTRKTLSPVIRFFSPGWGSCGCCGMTWNIVRGHDTPYGEAVSLPVEGGTVKANGTTVTVCECELHGRCVIFSRGTHLSDPMVMRCSQCADLRTPAAEPHQQQNSHTDNSTN